MVASLPSLYASWSARAGGVKDSNEPLPKGSVSIIRKADGSIGAQLCEYRDGQLDVG